MSGRQILIVGCLTVFILGILASVIAAYFVYNWMKDPEDVTVTISAPEEVLLKEPMDLIVQIENTRSHKTFKLTDIDVAEDFLEAFLVVSTTQEARSNTNVPFENTRSFHFNEDIPAGESREYTFTLRPLKSGIHRGDIDICEGMNFLTEMAQVYVLEEGESLAPSDDTTEENEEASGDVPEASDIEIGE